MTVGAKNVDFIERARTVTAAPKYDIEWRFPSVIERADGAWLYDLEDRRILDLTASSGAILLGHRHPAVTEAVIAQIRDYGTSFASSLSVPRLELAERICDRYPAMGKVVFHKTGSEGTLSAVRLARAATNRELILSSGYHGWQEWQLASQPFGFVQSTGVVGFDYDLAALEQMLSGFGGQVAGVIVSPNLFDYDLDHYRQMSRICAQYGVLFILDEVFTGFRAGPRGVHGTGEVPADLVVLSKGLANGHPLAAVMGRRDIVDVYDRAGVQGTYTRDIPPMAAALATLDVLADPAVYSHGEAIGRLLMDGIRDILSAEGIQARVRGLPMMFNVALATERFGAAIYRAAHDNGVYFGDLGTHLVTTAFDQQAVDHALSVFGDVVHALASHPDATAPLPAPVSDVPADQVEAVISQVIHRDRAMKPVLIGV